MILLPYIIWTMVFASVVLFIHGVMVYLDSRRTIKERIESTAGTPPGLTFSRKKEHPVTARLSQILSRWGNWAASDQERLSAVRQQLIYAGFRHPRAPLVYYGLRVFAALILPLPYLLSQIVGGLVNTNTLLYAFLLASLGYLLPQQFLKMKVRKRQNSLDRALPDVLDLFIICAEAGLALPATINKVAVEIKEVSKDFYQELQLTALELRTGLPWDVALAHLGERTGVMSIKSFVALLVQTDKLGTNIAQAMRTQADFTRVQRALKAEELANKLPVKMILPLAFFIFPGIMIVAAGPGIIKIMRIIIPMLQGRGH
jgi:tight adherence protein C